MESVKLLIIVFSCDRALQLDALLESILHFWKYPDYELHVLYRASNSFFAQGYNQLKNRYSTIVFHQETKQSKRVYSLSELSNLYNMKLLYLCPHLRGHKSDFRLKLLTILKQNKAKTVMFLTDDSVIIRPIQLFQEDINWLVENPAKRQISLRHGRELSGNQQLQITPNGFEWRFNAGSNNKHWTYRFSLDGHIYSRKIVLRLLYHASFSNPNSLESCGGLHACHRKILTEGRCYKNLCLLSYPINIVQSTFANDAMNADPSVLNDYFLKGYALQYPMMETISSFQVYPKEIFLVRDSEKISIPTQLLKNGI